MGEVGTSSTSAATAYRHRGKNDRRQQGGFRHQAPGERPIGGEVASEHLFEIAEHRRAAIAQVDQRLPDEGRRAHVHARGRLRHYQHARRLQDLDDAGYNPNNLYRNNLARYFLPSTYEWYKAAYYDPTSGVYYDYPTGSDSVPDGIDFVFDPNFDAVFFDCASNPWPSDITSVGLLSPYGTAGQGGNVREWQETDFDLVNDSSSSGRVIRGGSHRSEYMQVRCANRASYPVDDTLDAIGLRLVRQP